MRGTEAVRRPTRRVPPGAATVGYLTTLSRSSLSSVDFLTRAELNLVENRPTVLEATKYEVTGT